jgi:F-type H+-transporting ATPase subunit delta
MELAEEQGYGERLAVDLDIIRKAIKESREFSAFLKSPVISKEKKRSVLTDLFGKSLGDFTFNFLNLLVEKRREDLLRDIVDEFFRLHDDRLGIVTLELRTAAELTEAQQRTIVKRFEGITRKKIRIALSIDKQLKGGFVARVGDTVYDGSIQRQLELLRERFDEGTGIN